LEAHETVKPLVSWGKSTSLPLLFQVCGATDQGTDGAGEDEAGDA